MRLVGPLAALLAALLLVTACAPAPEDGTSGPGRTLTSDTDVDTPHLRKLKKQAQVAPCRPGSGAHVDGGLPDVTLPCLGGGEDVNTASLRGPMVVNLWASWCGPCRRELPIYQEFARRYGDRVRVLGIDYNDQMPEAALELLQDTGARFPQLAAPGAELNLQDPLPNFPGLPAIIFVDRDGRVVDENGDPRVVFEEIDDLDELEQLVEENLDVTL